MATDDTSWVCGTRKTLIGEWKQAVRQMAMAVEDMQSAVAADRKTFSLVHERVELARAAASSAREQLDLHRAEHGC